VTDDDVRPSALSAWPATGPARTVFEHPHHPTVLEEELLLPTGSTVRWLRYADHRDGAAHPDGVMGICLDGDRVLLSRQYNPGADRVVWEFPGGGTNPGEAYDDAVRRELMEEVDLFPHEVRPIGRFLLNNRRTGWGIRTYVCTELEERSLPADDGELIESCWIPRPEVDDNIRSGAIDNVTLLAGWALVAASRT
jgi:ADP-ribose pyrophosphatase YjhB (NUDIX family)